MSDLVLREDADGLSTLTLNRPDKMNALSVDLFEALAAHVAGIASSAAVRCVVLRGAGRCFSTGNDMGGIADGEGKARPDFQAHVVQQLATLPQPVIVAVHGHCYTGALELALAGDLIIAAQSAKFGDTHARFSLVPIWGMTQRLPRRVGTYKAREMMFTCRTYSGEEAAAMGLATTCVADADFDAAVGALTGTILAQSSHSQRAIKRLLAETDGLPLPAGLAHEIHNSPGQGPDMIERVTAFMNRQR